jgi:hypothetical protein
MCCELSFVILRIALKSGIQTSIVGQTADVPELDAHPAVAIAVQVDKVVAIVSLICGTNIELSGTKDRTTPH